MSEQAVFYHLGEAGNGQKVPAQPTTPERLARIAEVPGELMNAAVALVHSSERYDLNRALNFAQLAAGQAIVDLLAEVEGLTASRQYGRDIINDMTLEARDREAALQAAQATVEQLQQQVAGLEGKLEQGWNLLHYGVAALMADDANGVARCWEEGAKTLYLPTHQDIRPDFAPALPSAAPQPPQSPGN